MKINNIGSTMPGTALSAAAGLTPKSILPQETSLSRPAAAQGEGLHLSEECRQEQPATATGTNRLAAFLDRVKDSRQNPAGADKTLPQTGREKTGPAENKTHSAQGAAFSASGKTARADQAGRAGKPKKKKLTVLYYGAADNDLEWAHAQALIDMEQTGSTKDMNLLAQIDRPQDYDSAYGGKAGATRYFLQKSDNDEKISSPVLKDLGNADSADPKVFKDFIARGMKDYPAEKYLVICGGHGMGPTGLLPDDTSGTEMSLTGFGKALNEAEQEAGVKKDQVALGVHACKMGTAEFAYEVKDSASKLLVSESCTTSEHSWFMDKILADKNLADKDIDQIAESIFKSNTKCGTDTQSLLDLKQMPELKDKVKNFVSAAKTSGVAPEKLKALMEVKSRFHDPNVQADDSLFLSSDFKSLARNVSRDAEIKEKSPALHKASLELEGTLNKTIVASSHIDRTEFQENCQGLGVLVTDRQDLLKKYGCDKTAFARDTGWTEFTSNYASGVKMEQVAQELSGGREQESPQLKDLAEYSQKTKGSLAAKNDDELSEQIGDDHDLWAQLKDSSEPGASKDCMEATGAVLREVANGPREGRRAGWQGVMEVTSAFKDGKINNQTLAQGARNLLDAEKNAGLSEHEKNYMQEKGYVLLSAYGAITGDEKMINISNYHLNEPKAGLEQIAKMDQKAES